MRLKSTLPEPREERTDPVQTTTSEKGEEEKRKGRGEGERERRGGDGGEGEREEEIKGVGRGEKEGERVTVRKGEKDRVKEKKYKLRCDKRGVKFSLITQHRWHQCDHQRALRGGEGFWCEQCGLKCLSVKTLQKHLLLHSPARQYQCSQCSCRFHNSRCLKNHLATHQEEKPHTCDVCGRTYALKARLKDHQLLRGSEEQTTQRRGSDGAEDAEERVIWSRECKGEGQTEEWRGSKEQRMQRRKSEEQRGQRRGSEDSEGKDRGAEDAKERKGEEREECAEEREGEKEQRAVWWFVKPHLLREHRTRHHGEGKGGRRHFLCKECSVQVKLGCTSVTNVFSVTDFTHIKCFMKNHTLI
uniref:C2H2-type domain-containing protein n=1 Tax=Periophthalmus magnuspinnatus TaxID=409849 RepID=A0A3B4AWM6_9GOBI